MKTRLKNQLMENLGLKIVALFFAAVLWLVVVNVDDPVDTQVFRNISVNVTNTEVISSKGKTYQVLNNTQIVSVTVEAKRSVLAKIKNEDIVATADFNEMELSSLVPIKVTVSGRENDSITATANPHNLQVNVEDQDSNAFPLTVSTTGTLRDGYVLGELTTNPETITIGGAESLVKSISKAVARINISGMSESDTVAADLILYDAEGNVIDQTRLSNNLGDKGLSVNVEILETKNVPISSSISGIPAHGYVYNGMTIEPQTITVCGTKEDLEDFEEISIPASAIDVAGLTEKKEFVVDISKYLPENISLVDETNSNIVVTVLIESSGTKTIEFPVEGITVSNLAEDLQLEYVTTRKLELQFQGSQDILDKLDVKNAVFLDLKNYTETGEFEVPVTVEIQTDATLVNEPTVKIKLSKKE